uniref:Uncharacterized protein n=1 Tax=Oryza nivara TaxID=4536 RepID=A0A0E0IV89_ORYNI
MEERGRIWEVGGKREDEETGRIERRRSLRLLSRNARSTCIQIFDLTRVLEAFVLLASMGLQKTVKFWIVRDAFRRHSVLIRIAVPGLILQQELAWTPSFNHWNLEQAPKLGPHM